MMPAEHARLIDKQEFEAECQAVRNRVLDCISIKQAEDRARVQRFIEKPIPPGVFQRSLTGCRPAASEAPKPSYQRKVNRLPTRNAGIHAIAGMSLTRRQWAEELGITYNAMNQAVHRLGSVEAVVRSRIGASANG